MPERISLSSHSDLIAALPTLLTFTPEQSLVLLFLEDDTRSRQVRNVARMDLPAPHEIPDVAASIDRLLHEPPSAVCIKKTTSMRVYADAVRHAGGRVFAFGSNARAAQILGESIGATPRTLHQVPTALQAGVADRVFGFRPGDVVIIDEVGQAGTHTLHTVTSYALRQGADVRLIGDDKQLGAVEAGGAVRLIAHDVGAIRFNEVMRFHDPQQADASLRIRDGNPDGLEYYRDSGWIAAGSIETMRDKALSAWRADLQAGRETLLVMPRNEDVVALNLQAHGQRVARGEVDTRRTVQLHDGTVAARGDWVVTRDNRRDFWLFRGADFVKNGDTWHVDRIHRNGVMELTHRAHGGRVRLPPDYVAHHVELAYAATIHRTNGMTVADSAHAVVTPETTREVFYSAMTRSQNENRAYVVTSLHVADSHRETPPEQDPMAVLTGVLRHSGTEISATEALRDTYGEAESLSTLVLQHDYASEQETAARYRALLDRVHPQAGSTDAAPALLQTLRNVENQGWQAERVLPRVAAQGSLADADDVAALLQHRLLRHTQQHQPPARIAEPTADEIQQWRDLITGAVPTADVTDQRWDAVWWHAAAGARDGLDPTTALAHAADRLATRPATDPMDTHRFVGHALVAHLATQRAISATHRPALPWLAQHHRAAIGPPQDTQRHAYIHHINDAIAARTEELRHNVEHDQPTWAQQLGPRPQQPDAAAAWDQAARLAAAYRETFRITDGNPEQPFGQRPGGHGPQAHGWDTVQHNWQQATGTTPTEPAADDRIMENLQRQLDATATNRQHSPATEEVQNEHRAETSRYRENTDDLDADTDFGSGLRY